MSAHPSRPRLVPTNPTNPTNPADPTDPAAIQRLAEALAATAPPEPLLVRLHHHDRREVGLVPLHEIDPLSEHPADFLLGFEAPPEWWGVGLVAHAQVRALPGVADAAIDAPMAVTVCQIATRNGLVGYGVAADSHELPDAISPGMQPTTGRIPDLLQRSLQRPLAACPLGPGAWTDQRWLDALVAHVAAAEATPTWSALARRHPLADGSAPRPSRGRGAAHPEALRARSRQLDAIGWERLLAADPVSAAQAVGFADPDRVGCLLLEWVGAEVVGNWLLGQLPRAADLLAALAALLPEPMMAKIRAALTPGTMADVG